MKTILTAIAGGATLLAATHSTVAQTWTPTDAPSNSWVAVASSADGRILVAGTAATAIYTSTNFGATWNSNGIPNANWTCAASSADGGRLIAATGVPLSDGGTVYTSTNLGVNWVTNNLPQHYWRSVASSADGERLVASASLLAGDSSSRCVYISTNGGSTWSSNNPYGGYIALSADGTKLFDSTGYPSNAFYFSTNFGGTWRDGSVPVSSVANWYAVASSADGTKLAVTASDLPAVFTSTNAGMDWQSNSIPDAPGLLYPWPAMSADGSRLAIAGYDGSIHTSTDFGATWVSNNIPSAYWESIAASADGTRLVAVANAGGIYAWQTTPAPGLHISTHSGNVMLSWLTPSTNFFLQQDPNLAAAGWSDVTNVPALNFTNLNCEVTLPSANSSRFFRLKTP